MAQLARIEWSDGGTNRFYADTVSHLVEVLDELMHDYPGTIVDVQWPHEEEDNRIPGGMVCNWCGCTDYHADHCVSPREDE